MGCQHRAGRGPGCGAGRGRGTASPRAAACRRTPSCRGWRGTRARSCVCGAACPAQPRACPAWAWRGCGLPRTGSCSVSRAPAPRTRSGPCAACPGFCSARSWPRARPAVCRRCARARGGGMRGGRGGRARARHCAPSPHLGWGGQREDHEATFISQNQCNVKASILSILECECYHCYHESLECYE